MGSHLRAQKVLKAIIKYLGIEPSISDLGIELVNGRLFCMDTTNLNSDEKSGMKHLLQYAVPLAVWIGCGNYKVALYPVLVADAMLLAL